MGDFPLVIPVEACPWSFNPSPPGGGVGKDRGAARGFCRWGGETAVRLDAAEGVALLPAGAGNPVMASNGSLRGLAPSPSFPRSLPSNASIAGRESRQAESVLIRKSPCTPLSAPFPGHFAPEFPGFRPFSTVFDPLHRRLPRRDGGAGREDHCGRRWGPCCPCYD